MSFERSAASVCGEREVFDIGQETPCSEHLCAACNFDWITKDTFGDEPPGRTVPKHCPALPVLTLTGRSEVRRLPKRVLVYTDSSRYASQALIGSKRLCPYSEHNLSGVAEEAFHLAQLHPAAKAHSLIEVRAFEQGLDSWFCASCV